MPKNKNLRTRLSYTAKPSASLNIKNEFTAGYSNPLSYNRLLRYQLNFMIMRINLARLARRFHSKS